ncbi:MAG: GlcG/HbpS family heme-binding protein [Stellaceae bacterium]
MPLVATALPASGQGLIETHRVPADLAAEAVTTAVDACARQGYPVTSILLDGDGILQAELRGDGAGIHTVQMAHDKAYTAISFRTDTSALVARVEKRPSPAIAKLPNLILAPGGVVIMEGKEVIGAIAVSGVPNPTGDEVCAKAGLAKIGDRLNAAHSAK